MDYMTLKEANDKWDQQITGGKKKDKEINKIVCNIFCFP